MWGGGRFQAPARSASGKALIDRHRDKPPQDIYLIYRNACEARPTIAIARVYRMEDENDERTPLLERIPRNGSVFQTPSIKDEEEDYLAASAIGERLPYSSYTSIGIITPYGAILTVDWLHEVVKASAREKYISGLTGIRGRLIQTWDAIQGWTAVALIGFFTAVVAFLVDVAQATVFDWKLGAPLPSSRANCRILQRKLVASAIKLLSWFNLSHLHSRAHVSRLATMVLGPLQHPYLIPRKRIPNIRSHCPCLGSHLRLPHPPHLPLPPHPRLGRIRPCSFPTKGTIHGRWFRNP